MGLEIRANVAEVTSVVVGKEGNTSGITRSPLYLRGTNSLTAEMAALKNRDNPDAFIDNLREIESEMGFLQSIEIDYSNLRAAEIDQAAVPPDKKSKPRRSLIVGLSALIGIFASVVVSLLIGMVQQQSRLASRR